MKKFSRLALGVIAFCVAASSVRARLVGTAPTNPDAWCVNGGSLAGGSSTTGGETCVDYSGNFIPTVTGVQTLGSASFAWSNVYSAAATVTGNDTNGTAGSTPAVGTGGTAASQSATLGVTVYTPYQVGSASGSLGIFSSTSIPVNATYEVLLGSGASSSLLTSTPNISTTTVVGSASTLTGLPSGTLLVLTSTAAAGAIFQDEGTLTNSKLQLGAATREVKQYKTLTLIFNAADGYWREISYGNN